MKENTIKNILVFLGRVQLTGAEVAAYNEVVNELKSELTKPVEATIVESENTTKEE